MVDPGAAPRTSWARDSCRTTIGSNFSKGAKAAASSTIVESSRAPSRCVSMSLNARSGCGPSPVPPSRRSQMAMASETSSRSTPVPGRGSSEITARQAGSGVADMKSP